MHEVDDGMNDYDLTRRLVAEFLGAGFLLATSRRDGS